MSEERKAKQDAFCAAEPWAKLATEAGFRPLDTESSARHAFRYCAENMVKRDLADALAAALRDLRGAVCGETGFAQCVRDDSGTAYPWPALDAAEEAATAALAAWEARK